MYRWNFQKEILWSLKTIHEKRGWQDTSNFGLRMWWWLPHVLGSRSTSPEGRWPPWHHPGWGQPGVGGQGSVQTTKCRSYYMLQMWWEWTLALCWSSVWCGVLAFVLHHVPMSARAALLAEALRVGHQVLVLEDLPDEALSANARRLAWLVTEEHLGPLGKTLMTSSQVFCPAKVGSRLSKMPAFKSSEANVLAPVWDIQCLIFFSNWKNI